MLAVAVLMTAAAIEPAQLPPALVSVGVIAGHGTSDSDMDPGDPEALGLLLGGRAGLEVGPEVYQRVALSLGYRYLHGFGSGEGTQSARATLHGFEFGTAIDLRSVLVRPFLWLGWANRADETRMRSESSTRAFAGVGLAIAYQLNASALRRPVRFGVDVTAFRSSFWGQSEYVDAGPVWGGATLALFVEPAF